VCVFSAFAICGFEHGKNVFAQTERICLFYLITSCASNSYSITILRNQSIYAIWISIEMLENFGQQEECMSLINQKYLSVKINSRKI